MSFDAGRTGKLLFVDEDHGGRKIGLGEGSEGGCRLKMGLF